jgi:hypothetical protein
VDDQEAIQMVDVVLKELVQRTCHVGGECVVVTRYHNPAGVEFIEVDFGGVSDQPGLVLPVAEAENLGRALRECAVQLPDPQGGTENGDS